MVRFTSRLARRLFDRLRMAGAWLTAGVLVLVKRPFDRLRMAALALKRRGMLRWPFDAEDTHVYGGIVLVATGAGTRWGWSLGLLIAGAALVSIGLFPHLINLFGGRGRNVAS